MKSIKQKKKNSAPKTGPTAPKHIEEKDLEKIRKMAGVGLPVAYIAAILGMSKNTFERKMREFPDIYEALEKGRAENSGEVANAAFEMARSGQCPTMTIFWLKTRLGWREKSEVTHLIQTKSSDELSDLSLEELMNEYKKETSK